MKKILTLLIALFIVATFAATIYAEPLLLTYDGQVHEYPGNILKLKINDELVNTDIPPVIISDRSLVPARAVFEKLGAKVDWDETDRKVTVAMSKTNVELKINDVNAKVNNKKVEMEVPAKIINDRTMIPLRFVGEQLDMVVGWHPEDAMVTIDNKEEPAKGELKKVTSEKEGNIDKVVIYLDEYEGYNIFRLSAPDRIVIDVPYTKIKERRRIDVNDGSIESIRYDQFEETIARIVLDVTGQPDYIVEENEGQLVLKLESSLIVTPVENSNTNASAEDENFKIECKSAKDGDKIEINIEGYDDYNAFRLTDTDRIVIDIEGARATDNEEHKIAYSSSLIKSVRYSNLGQDSLRVVLDTVGQPEFSFDEEDDRLVVEVQKPSYKNIFYHNSGDRVYLTLGGVALTEGGEELEKFYTEEYKKDGKRYTISFPSELADIGSGEMVINDGFLESIEIDNNSRKQQTNIVFNAKSKYSYEVMARSSEDDTSITILKPRSNKDKLVVIDPGHGGREVGAVYGSTYEKDLNLDIAKRLNTLLKKKNVNTYMTRQDDSYVGLYERAYIANELNATLFLSVHNNAINNPDFGGTMTLYYPQRSNTSGFNGKRFAQIIQGTMLAKLGTTDRKIIERPNLVVLKATTMPSALAEVAFMTNKQDRENLLDENFRQKAAEALCESILQALEEVD